LRNGQIDSGEKPHPVARDLHLAADDRQPG